MFLLKSLSLAVLISFPLPAQFRDLSTDDTGSRVWFSSPLRLRGTEQQVHDKLFTADADGRITLLAERPANNPSYVTERLFAFWVGSVLPAPPPSGPQVLFAGLAPGFVGVYQVDLRLPQDAPLAQLGVSIQVGNSNAIASFPVGAAR